MAVYQGVKRGKEKVERFATFAGQHRGNQQDSTAMGAIGNAGFAKLISAAAESIKEKNDKEIAGFQGMVQALALG